jgi:hypothetical protein
MAAGVVINSLVISCSTQTTACQLVEWEAGPVGEELQDYNMHACTLSSPTRCRLSATWFAARPQMATAAFSAC